MEVIKISPNVEFDVIYADGTRKRVQEGVLCEAEPGGEMIFHNGTDRSSVWVAAAETMLVALHTCGALKILAAGMIMSTDSFSALKELTEVANAMIVVDRPAIFRLGQMDFRQCAADMLEAHAALLKDIDVDAQIISTLNHAAEMILAMEIPGGANE